MPAWAVIEHDQRILLIKRSPKTSRPGQWCFPGGGINAGEDPKQACQREAKEEVGLDIKAHELISNINDHHYYQCELLDPIQEIILNQNECVELQWILPRDILALGQIMNLRHVISILNRLGYQIDLTDEVIQYIGASKLPAR